MNKERALRHNNLIPESKPWHALSPQEVLTHLKVREEGLSGQEAAVRLQ